MDDSSTPPIPTPPVVPAAPNDTARNESILLTRLFLTKTKARRPYATWGLAVLIGLVFAMQLFIGHMDTNAAFIRSGALYPPRVWEHGEFWRLASCTFLHADWMHVLFNVYVLVILGVFVERIIGTPRFLLVYVGSAFAGSVGSLFFLGEGFSVGASGAVWGLLGAHAILAFRPTGLLPELMLPGVKKAAMINLGLNVLNSFRPQVDMWAHFAGGAAGALIFLLVSRGVPRAPTSEGEPVPNKVPAPSAMWPIAALALLVLTSLAGVAIAQGKPFELDTAPNFERTELPWVSLSAEVPSNLLEHTQELEENGNREVLAGDVVENAMMVGVFAMDLPALSPEEIGAEIESLISLPVPEDTSTVTPPERMMIDGHSALVMRHRYENGVSLERVFTFYPGRLIRVSAYRWPSFERATPPNTAERIARSVRF